MKLEHIRNNRKSAWHYSTLKEKNIMKPTKPLGLTDYAMTVIAVLVLLTAAIFLGAALYWAYILVICKC